MESETSIEELESRLVDQAERDLLAEFTLGEQNRKWLKTPTGRYVVGVAVQETTEFMRWVCHPGQNITPEEFTRRRANLLAARMGVHWVMEQIEAAEVAGDRLSSR